MKVLLYSLLAVFMCHCASVSTLQTGRVLEEGKSSHSVGVGTYSSDDFLGGDDISLPLIEYAYRRGIWKDIDAGIKLAIIGATVLDVKYNFVNSEKFAMATGLGFGYLSFESEVTAGNQTVTQKSTIIDVILPLYVSYDVAEMFTLYTAPKYIFRSISGNGLDVSGDGSMMSTSLGFQWGRKSGVMLEGSLITGLDNDFSGSQYNVAYFFKL